ncbi:hypothetical protein D3C75_1329400 [compost metagenome]
MRELFRGSLFIDEARCDALCFALQKRIAMLSEVVHSRTSLLWADDRKTDVEEDIAYSGVPDEEDWERS